MNALVERLAWQRIAVSFGHDLDARMQLAEYLDAVADRTGDSYFAGLADGVRVARPINAPAHPKVWN